MTRASVISLLRAGRSRTMVVTQPVSGGPGCGSGLAMRVVQEGGDGDAVLV
jgi:hypothetical protein